MVLWSSWTGDPSEVTKKKKKGEHVGEEQSRSDNSRGIPQRFKLRSPRPRVLVLLRRIRRARSGDTAHAPAVKKTTTAFVHPIVRLLAGRDRSFASTSPSSVHAPTIRRARAALGRTDGDDARRAADDQSRAGGRPDGRGRASTRRWQPTFTPRVTERADIAPRYLSR